VRFREALAAPGLSAIAEVKRRSPSAGDLRPDADPAALAAAYERAGAAAVSVLVDHRFAGSWDDLRAARSAAGLPLLAKGFFSSEGDLRAAKDAGADAVLLILRDLDDEIAMRLMHLARNLGLDTLVEAHDERELLRAVALGADPIGINARNLDTFVVDLRAALTMFANAPRDRILVAESGIKNRADAVAAELAGADAILVGSALMRAADPAERLTDLIRRPLIKVCGLTRQEDVDAAADAGADFAGFILADESPRRAERVLDVPASMMSVAVLVGPPRSVDADLVQLYERERRHRSRYAALFRRGYGESVATVVDLPWEQEDPSHFERARGTPGRVMLAGGLSPENVREAIKAVRPWAVDAARSLEVEPGIKDHARVRAFVEAARC
jgi:indole-3-glycerol phosphate synthase/phosphoribosylanthranilate isomerase